MSEFELIKRYFTRHSTAGSLLALGIGDDCALLDLPPGETLAVSTDMLVEGRHFFAGADPEALGHKALAVNLSDLAAMGARPLGFTLALSLPAAEADWLEKFSRGLFALAESFAVPLIGGDTTRGPLNLCITVLGSLPYPSALRRDGARAGDDIWVSGSLGDARLALEILQARHTPRPVDNEPLDPALLAVAEPRLHRPSPRVALGLALRGVASAAIDLSDGLLGDLNHLLHQSGAGAVIQVDALPLGPALATLPLERRRAWALNGGDDYELCFTAAPAQAEAVRAAGVASGVSVTRIGQINAQAGIQLVDSDGHPLPFALSGFDHFS
jgi:thiamine-monophosphate kinase